MNKRLAPNVNPQAEFRIVTVTRNPMTKAEASKEFAKNAKAFALENSLDFAVAWHQAKTEFPELYEAAFGATALSNETKPNPERQRMAVKGILPGTVAIPNAENIEALGLPRDASYDEFAAANRAAEKVPANSPLRKHVLFTALVHLFGGTPEAEKRAAKRFPKLAPNTY